MPSVPATSRRNRRLTSRRKIGPFRVRPEIYFAWQLTKWLCKRPQSVLVIVAFFALRKFTGQWWIAFVSLAAVAVIASVIWLARHPFLLRLGVKPSITALSRRRRVKKKWEQAALDTGMWRDDKRKLRVAKLTKVRLTAAGNVTAYVNAGFVGRTTEHVSSVAPVIAAVTRCPYVAVRNSKTHPGATVLEFRFTDELSALVTTKEIEHFPVRRDKLVFGITETGKPATISLSTSLLLVGLTESGKSNSIWALLAWLNRTGQKVRLWVFDPKGGMELGALREKAHFYGVDPQEIAVGLSQCVNEMKEAQRRFAAKGMRKFTLGTKVPLNLIIIDEFLALGYLSTNPQQKAQVQANVNTLQTQGRAVGFVGWFATQAAQIDALGRSRTFIPQRVCYRVENVESAIAALGTTARTQGKAHEISEDDKGIGFLSIDGERGLTRFRAAYVPDSDIPDIVAGRWPRGASAVDVAAAKLPRGNILRRSAATIVRAARWVAARVRQAASVARGRARVGILTKPREEAPREEAPEIVKEHATESNDHSLAARK